MLITIIIAGINLYGKPTCKVQPIIMYSIAQLEGSNQFPVGYPYIISINNKKDVKTLEKTKLKAYFINNRTINCKSQQFCVSVTKLLIHNHITNVDLGAFQLNYYYHPYKQLSIYFNLRKSYNTACAIISKDNAKKWAWDNVAKYHSWTTAIRNRYKQKLLALIYQNYIKEHTND